MFPIIDNKARSAPLMAAPNCGDKIQQKYSSKFKKSPHACNDFAKWSSLNNYLSNKVSPYNAV